MKTVLKMLAFGVAAILTVKFISWAFSYMKPAESLNNKANKDVANLTATLLEEDLMKYDGQEIAGSTLVAELIPKNQNSSDVEVLVVTKADCLNRSGTSITAMSYTGKSASEWSGAKKVSVGGTECTITFSVATRYSITDTSHKDYVNLNALYKVSVLRNANGFINAVYCLQTS